ncbi:ADP-ribose pyrophosphatase [Salipaludibacillus keqinensis]|uniref:ADP-ribose pyrophosphatase n=1 Tax=Salipaludibacillus keqinensis TaxID=2045207 RepID=A0A323TL24_9BACI|nr:NUDIX hydrolase [Salipaludibacillus keqinensis]PYZ94427.1 ADP-ribose pyrophosphatase [Salipaludibacillus keqinensis]
MNKKFEEKTTRKKSIFKGKIIDLDVHEVLLPNGKESKREIIEHPGAVAIITFTPEGKLILVKQYRKALEKAIAEIPAGKLEKGEDPLECAKRELEEETGVKARDWSKLNSFYTSPGFANEIVHVYLAEGLEVGIENTDEDEFVERVDVTLEEANQMILTGEIHDAKTIYAVQYWQLRQLRAFH